MNPFFKTVTLSLLIASTLGPSVANSFDTQTYQELASKLSPESIAMLNNVNEKFLARINGMSLKRQKAFYEHTLHRINNSQNRLTKIGDERWSKQLNQLESLAVSNRDDSQPTQTDSFTPEEKVVYEGLASDVQNENKSAQRMPVQEQKTKFFETLKNRSRTLELLSRAKLETQKQLNQLEGRNPAQSPGDFGGLGIDGMIITGCILIAVVIAGIIVLATGAATIMIGLCLTFLPFVVFGLALLMLYGF